MRRTKAKEMCWRRIVNCWFLKLLLNLKARRSLFVVEQSSGVQSSGVDDLQLFENV